MTRPASLPDIPSDFSLSPRSKLARKVNVPGQCSAVAPCGEKCCLDASIKHALHCCYEPLCDACHGRKRYEEKHDY